MPKVIWDLERMQQAYLSLASELGRPPLRQDLDRAAVAEPSRMPSSTDYDLFFDGKQWLKQLAGQVGLPLEPQEFFETESLGSVVSSGKKLPYTNDLGAWLSGVTPQQLNEYLGHPAVEWGVVGYYRGSGHVAQLRVVPIGDLGTKENHYNNFALKIQRDPFDIQIVNAKNLHQADLRHVVSRARSKQIITETEKLLGRPLHSVEMALLKMRFRLPSALSDHRVDGRALARWLHQVTPTQLHTVLGNLPESWALMGSVKNLGELQVVTPDKKLSEHPSQFKLTMRTTATGVQLVAAEGWDAGFLVHAIVRERLGQRHLSAAEGMFISAYMDLDKPRQNTGFILPQNWRLLAEQLPGKLPDVFVIYSVKNSWHELQWKISPVADFEDYISREERAQRVDSLIIIRQEGSYLRPLVVRGAGVSNVLDMIGAQRGRELSSEERVLIEISLGPIINNKTYNVGEVEGVLEWLKKATPQQLSEIKPDWPAAFGLVGHKIDRGGGQRVENLRLVPVETMANLEGVDNFGALVRMNANGYYSVSRVINGVIFDLAHIEKSLNRPVDSVEKLLLSDRLGLAVQPVTVQAVHSWLSRISPQELHHVIGEQPKDWVLAIELGAEGNVINIRIVSDADAAKFSGLYLRPTLKHQPPNSQRGFVTVEALSAPLLAPIDGAFKLMDAVRTHTPRVHTMAAQTLRGGAVFFMGSLGADAVDALRSGDWSRFKNLSPKDVATDYAALTVGGGAGHVVAKTIVSHIPTQVMPLPVKSLAVRTGGLAAGLTLLNRLHSGEFHPEQLPKDVATILAASGVVQGATAVAGKSRMLMSAARFLNLTTTAGKATFWGAVVSSVAEFVFIREISHMTIRSALEPVTTEVRHVVLQLLHADAIIQNNRRLGLAVDEGRAQDIRRALQSIQRQLMVVPTTESQLIRAKYDEELDEALSARDAARRMGISDADWNYSRAVARIETRYRSAIAEIIQLDAKATMMMPSLSAAVEFQDSDDDTVTLPNEQNETKDTGINSIDSLLQWDLNRIAHQLNQYLTSVNAHL